MKRRKTLKLDPAIEDAAADWLLRHDRGLTAREQDEFLQWLAAGPAHRESFTRHREMWSDFDALSDWRPHYSAEPNADLFARPRRRSFIRRIVPAALALAAVVAILASISALLRSDRNEPVAFEAASYQEATLPDGTVMDLNRGAHAVVQFSASERRVLLVQGEAQFTVARNPARPFIVRAGGVDVCAVGTAFNVKLSGGNLEVLVTQGTVHVSPQQPAAADGTERHAAPVRAPVLAELSAGDRTVLPIVAIATVPERPTVVSVSSEEIERLLEWKPRLLDFDSTPLAEVVEKFNRRNATQLVVADAELRALPIVASIRSDNVAGFVRLLEATMGVRAEHRPSGEIVLHTAR
jgi:transmembrane sensor